MNGDNGIYFQASCLKNQLASETQYGGECTIKFLRLELMRDLTPEFLVERLERDIHVSSGGNQTPHAEFYGNMDPDRMLRPMLENTQRVLIIGPKSKLSGVKTDVLNHIDRARTRYRKAKITVLFGDGKLDVQGMDNMRILAATKERIRYYLHRIFRCGKNIAVFISAHGRSGHEGEALCLEDRAVYGLTEDPSKCITDNDFKDHFLAFRVNGEGKTAVVFIDTCHSAGCPGPEDFNDYERKIMRSKELGNLADDSRFKELEKRVLPHEAGNTDDWEADFLRTQQRGKDEEEKDKAMAEKIVFFVRDQLARKKAQALAEKMAEEANTAARAAAEAAAEAEAAKAAEEAAKAAEAEAAAKAAEAEAAAKAAEAEAAKAAQAAKIQPSLSTHVDRMFTKIGQFTQLITLLRILFGWLPWARIRAVSSTGASFFAALYPHFLKMDFMVNFMQFILGWSYLYLFSLTICGVCSILVLLIYLRDYTQRMFGCTLFVSVMCLLIQQMCNPLIGTETLTVTERLNFVVVSFVSALSCILVLVWASRREIKGWKKYIHCAPSVVQTLRILMAYHHLAGIDTMSHGIRLTNDRVILYTPLDAQAICRVNTTIGSKMLHNNYSNFIIADDSTTAGCNYTLFKSMLKNWTDGDVKMINAITLGGERLDLQEEVVMSYIQNILDHALPISVFHREYEKALKMGQVFKLTLKHEMEESAAYKLFKKFEYAGERFDNFADIIQSILSVIS